MFFDCFLLSSQHGGRFGIAWIAATRGISYVNKRDILELDTGKLCDDIAQYLTSQSETTRARFSLRLSAILINGTLKIYRAQINQVLADVVKVLTIVSKPAYIQLPFSRTEFDTPPTPVTKKRTKRRRIPLVEESTPESQLATIIEGIKALEAPPTVADITQEDLAVLEARVDEITIRETQLPPHKPSGDDFGPLSVLEDLNEEMGAMELASTSRPTEPIPSSTRRSVRLPSGSSSPSQPDATVRMVVEAQVHVPAETRGRSPIRIPEGVVSMDLTELQAWGEGVNVEGIRPIERPVEVEPAPVGVVGERIRPIEEEQRIVLEVEPAPVGVPDEGIRPMGEEARTVLGELQLERVEKRKRERKVATTKKKDDLAKLRIVPNIPRVLRINRCELNEVQYTDIELFPVPIAKYRPLNLTNLLNVFVVSTEQLLDVARPRPSEATSTERDSGVAPIRRPPPRITSPLGPTIEPAVVVPELVPEDLPPQIIITTSTPTKRKPDDSRQLTAEEVVAVAAEAKEEESTPRKRRRLFEPSPKASIELDHITIPSELQSHELVSESGGAVTSHLPTAGDDSVPSLPVETQEARQQHIVDKVFAKGRVTLEDVSQRPLNRLNVARAFSDVLGLSKYGYVTLVSEEDSTELKYIEKGPKFL